jgi:hypothetical protein
MGNTNGVIGQQNPGLFVNQHDFIYKNNFKNRVWSYVRTNPNLTFKEYQRIAHDNQCREGVFDDVKREAQAFGIWDPVQKCIVPKTPSAIERIEALNHQNEKAKEPPPPLPATPPSIEQVLEPVAPSPIGIGTQLALDNAAPRRQKRRLDEELKEIVTQEIKAKPTITYEELQERVKWPEFTLFNFYTHRRKLIELGQIEIPAYLTGRGRLPCGEALLARKHLMEMNPDEIQQTSYPKYKTKYGNHGLSEKDFSRAHGWALKQRNLIPNGYNTQAMAQAVNPMAAAAKPIVLVDREDTSVAPVVVKPSTPRNMFAIIASIPFPETLPEKHYGEVAKMFAQYFEERLTKVGKKNPFKCNAMTDPACIEIRKPVN